MDAPGLSVIVPVYRSAQTLAALHGRLRAALGPEAEILYVNDACPAGSEVALAAIARADRGARVLTLACNAGQNRAVMMGLYHARGERMVVLDADLQDPPEAIPALLDRLGGEVHAVFAGRRGRYEARARLAGSRLIKGLLHRLSGGRIPADAGLFLALDRRMAQAALAWDTPAPYLISLMSRAGLGMVSIPVERAERPGGASAYTFRKRLAVALFAARALLDPFLRRVPPGQAAWQVPLAPPQPELTPLNEVL